MRTSPDDLDDFLRDLVADEANLRWVVGQEAGWGTEDLVDRTATASEYFVTA